MKRDEGQGLIEIAIAVPLLLLILIGIVDVGRLFYYTIALSNGVREGAAYAATQSGPNDATTLQRVCDASGLAPLGSPCDGMVLEDASVTGGAQRVVVTYDVELFYARVLGALGGSGTLQIRASATYPVVAP